MAWTAPRGYVDDVLEAQLKEHFSDGQIVELGMVCAQLVGMAKLLFAFDWADKEDYCPLAPLEA
jgi:alkylhydroperoxidase family enzyme